MKKPAVLRVLGVALSTLPPAAAALAYFPLFKDNPLRMISGITLLLLMLCALPLFRLFKKRNLSPGVPGVWIFTFLVFYFFRSIAEEVTVVAFFGAVGNLFGALLFRLAAKESEHRE